MCVNCVVGVYNKCIYKFDHYCVWIANCVGGLNRRYFLALLVSLTAMCFHGVWGIVKVFSSAITVYQIQTTGVGHLISVTQIELSLHGCRVVVICPIAIPNQLSCLYTCIRSHFKPIFTKFGKQSKHRSKKEELIRFGSKSESAFSYFNQKNPKFTAERGNS